MFMCKADNHRRGKTAPPSGPLLEVTRCYRVDRRRIALLRFLLEGYEGLAVLRTRDPAKAVVALHLSASRESELDEFLEGLSGQIRLEPAAFDARREKEPHLLHHGRP